MERREKLLVDTHTHLAFEQFDQDRPDVIRRAFSSGVGVLIEVGTDLECSRKAVELASRHQGISASVGIHPHDASSLNPEVLERLRSLAHSPKVIAIGEAGLDFYRDLSPRKSQVEAFRQQIRLAHELSLPLIVHVRNAYPEAFSILRDERIPRRGGVMHCFSGGPREAREAVDLGFHIACGGSITYSPRASGGGSGLFSVMAEVPPERILLETDSPYLAPVPLRGKRNEPANLSYIASTLAEALKLSRDDVERITRVNALRLFDLPDEEEPRIAYPIRNSLYLNITNRCTNTCTFCVRTQTDFVKGHNLRLDHEPSFEEVIAAVGDPTRYDEVVFCGLGEPLLRLDLLKQIARWLKDKGARVRLNTNGQGNLIWNRNILPELVGLVDEISVSLNAPTAEIYDQICPSRFGPGTFERVKEFVKEGRKLIPSVSVTVVTLPGIGISACREVAEKELGVPLRVRAYNVVG